MAFCFYLRTIEDIQTLLIRIEELKHAYEKCGKSFFLSVMEKNHFMDGEESEGSHSNDNVEGNPASFEYSSLEFRDISDSLWLIFHIDYY